MLSLNGCATSLQAAPDPVVIDLRPSATLLQPCRDVPPREITTNGELTRFLFDMMQARDDCAAQIDAIRAFYGEN